MYMTDMILPMHDRELKKGSAELLIMSQVILSLTLPIPMITLVILTNRRDVMGEFVNRWPVACAAIIGTTIVLMLNLVLLLQLFGVPLPLPI